MDPMVEAETRKLTYEDYCAIPEDRQRHEIIDGEHFVSPSPLDLHQMVSGNLSGNLWNFLRRTKLGILRVAPSDVLLGKHDVVVPDLYVILAGNLDRKQRNGCHGPPDLVVEILSESRPEYDLVKKRRLYERTRVPEYWIIDPRAERVEVYRREVPGAFARPVVLTADSGDTLETPLLPGFTLPVAELFQEA